VACARTAGTRARRRAVGAIVTTEAAADAAEATVPWAEHGFVRPGQRTEPPVLLYQGSHTAHDGPPKKPAAELFRQSHDPLTPSQ
jgi:hypothetical protein